MIATVFDIETGPQDEALILDRFDESKVALGVLKDPKKIEAKIEEARQKKVEQAPLSAADGRLVAIGYLTKDDIDINYRRPICSPNWEAATIAAFWNRFLAAYDSGHFLVGFNCHEFDLPFLRRRSLILGIKVPDKALEKGRYWSEVFIDVMKVWQGGNSRDYISLDTLGHVLGLGGKPKDVTGADFWKYLQGTEEERKKALEYLENDLRLTQAIARHFKLI